MAGWATPRSRRHRRKAPGFALLGEPGEASDVVLELKTVADVGLVGFPSAGKSSLVAAMSAARPKIADYPFTTLVPNLGVVEAGEVRFTVADVPGLIPGASEGRGLGLEFLRHIERCAALAHVVDCATEEPGRDPLSDIDAIEAELAAYGGLADRPRLVVLNKIDVPAARELAELVRPDIEARGWRVHVVSAVTHEGLRELAFAFADVVATARAAAPLAGADAHRASAHAQSTSPGSRSRRSATTSWSAARSRSAGCGRPTSATTRRSATSPTGWPGSVSRRRWPSSAPSPARRSSSATVAFDWVPTAAAGVPHEFGPRGGDLRLEGR